MTPRFLPLNLFYPPRFRKKWDFLCQKDLCIVRESNPGRPRGRRAFYHWTNDAKIFRQPWKRQVDSNESLHFGISELKGERTFTARNNQSIGKKTKTKKHCLPDGESNPGLLRDRQGYLPLYYQGLAERGKLTHQHKKAGKRRERKRD